MEAENNTDVAYFVLGAGQSQGFAIRKKAEKHTNQNKTPVISRYRPFVLLLTFHNNNSTIRPPGAYRAMSHGACCLLSLVVMNRILFHSSCAI